MNSTEAFSEAKVKTKEKAGKSTTEVTPLGIYSLRCT